MGWLPSAPQLKTNPMQVAKDAAAAGMDAKDYVVKSLKDGTLTPVVLTAATVYRREKRVIALDALAAGDRVVVNIGNGKAPITARAVDAGASTRTSR